MEKNSFESQPMRYLRLFQEVTCAITGTLDESRVPHLIARKLPEVFGVDAATIRLLDPSGEVLSLVAAHSLSREYLDRGPLDDEKSVATALSGKPVAIEDAATDPRIQYPEEAEKEGIKSLLVAPILMRGEVKGVLRLLSRNRRIFSKEEIDFAAALARQCGIALENARAYTDQKRQLSYFRTLDTIGKALNSTRDLAEVLQLIVDRLPKVMTLKGCTIRLTDRAKGRLSLVAASGLSDAYLSRGSIDDELATHRTLGGEPVLIYDAATDPRNHFGKAAEREGVGSILAVPIVVQGRSIGVLRLLSGPKRHFREAEINFAVAVGEQAGIAINSAVNFQKQGDLVTELQHHEEFLENILDSLDAELFVVDENHRIVMLNRTFLLRHGLGETEAIGRPVADLFPASGLSDSLAGVKKDQPFTRTFTRGGGEGGEKHFFELTAMPVCLYQDDRVDYIVGAIRDITAHVSLKEAQREQERLQGTLEMAGAVAHELNNPLAIAQVAARLLLKEAEREGRETTELALITKNLHRMTELIGKMTGITRYTAKRYVGDTKIVDVHPD